MAIPFYDKRESLARAHRHFDMQRFVAAPGAHAAHRRRGEVVAADGEAAMALAREHAVRDVHAHPAFAFDPDVGPGMACGLLVVSGIDVAADVAGRHASSAAAGDEKVRGILAYAAAQLARVRGRAGHLPDSALLLHRAADRPREVQGILR